MPIVVVVKPVYQFALGDLRCPICRHNLSAATAVSDEGPPRTGDISLCINCAAVLFSEVDGKAITYRVPKDDEIRRLRELPETWSTIEKAQRQIRMR